MFNKQDNIMLFYNKKSYIERRLQHDVIENGISYIPCRVNNIDDVISKYSVKDCQSLNSEFIEYIMGFIDCIPVEYPVVLEIHGPKFSSEEKKIITEATISEMDYRLGKTEEDIQILRKRFICMVAGTVLSGVLLYLAKLYITDVPLEFFYVIFWLFADATVRYLFIEKMDFKDEKIRAGRMASLKVEFVELCESA